MVARACWTIASLDTSLLPGRTEVGWIDNAFSCGCQAPARLGGAECTLLVPCYLTALRSDSIIFQPASPGNRASQKRQPLTALPVIETAAADGESYRLPFSTSAPDSTRAR